MDKTPPPIVANENTFQLILVGGNLIPVRGSTDTSVFMSVMRGADTLSTILGETGLKKSTAFSSLKRLSETGAIDSRDDDGERKWYSNAFRVLESTETVKESLKPYFMESLFVRGDGSYKRLLTNAISLMASFGVSISPILDSMAIGIADRLYDQKYKETDAEEAIDICIRFLTDVDLARITLLDHIPLKIGVELTTPMPHLSASIYVQFVLTILSSFATLCTGDPYCISSTEETGEGTYVANLSPSIKKCPESYGNNILKDTRITRSGDDQWIYLIDGDIKIVKEKPWMDIIDAVSIYPRDALSISKITGMPRATVLLNVRRMVNEGILTSVGKGKTSMYSLATTHSFTWKGVNLENTADEDMELNLMISDSDSFFLHMMSYIILRGDSLGIDVGPLLYNISTIFADITMEHKKYTSIKDALSFLQESDFKTLHVTSFLPFTLVFVSPKKLNRKVARVASEFDVRYFSRLLEKITDMKYVLSESEVYGENNENHKLVFRPAV